MKILQVSNLFSPVHGGSAEVPYRLSKELGTKGHHVVIYTSDFKFQPEQTPGAVDVKAFNTWFALANLHVTPAIISASRKEIRHFDVIHMHNYRTFQNIVVGYYARKHKIPYVLQAHGSLTTFFHKAVLKRIFDIMWGSSLLKNASKVLAVTKTEAKQYESMGVSRDKISTVPNAVDLSEYDDLPQPGEFRKKHGFSDNQKIILYLGRIHKIKGLDLLVQAFAGVVQSDDNAQLVVVGPDGGYLPTLRQFVHELKIEDKVHIIGPLYGREKLEAFVDAEFYVLPSFYETFPVSVLEAWACGKAVIVTDRCGIADLVDGKAGLVVPYDKVLLQGALSNMLHDGRKRREFGEKGKSMVWEQYNWAKVAEEVEGIYRDAVPLTPER